MNPTPPYLNRAARNAGLASLAILGGGLYFFKSGSDAPAVATEIRVEREAAPKRSPSGGAAALQALPKSEQESLWAAFEAARRNINGLTPRETEIPGNEGVSAFSYNPRQDLATRYLQEGVRLSGGRKGDWEVNFEYDDRGSSSRFEASGTRAEFHHGDGVIEWYENRAEGVEHGFVLDRRPASAEGALRLDIALAGLHAVSTADPDVIELHSAEGEPKLKYSGLKAWDANGRPLQACMIATEEGIQLAVNDVTASYPITIDPLITSFEQELGPSVTGTGGTGDNFGASVAIDGNTVLIGADSDDTVAGTDAGSAYVFMNVAEEWTLQAVFRASDGASLDAFGRAVSITGDTAAVGAPLDDLPGDMTDAGSVRVFVRSGSIWTEQATLTAPVPAANEHYGETLSADGDTLVAGVSASIGKGSAYVHVRNGSTWSLQQTLTQPGDPPGTQRFGRAVSIDGDTLAVGSLRAPNGGGSQGGLFIYTRSAGLWSLQGSFSGVVSGITPGSFGTSVALSGDTVIAGAPNESFNGPSSGSVYLFTRNAGIWSQGGHFASATTDSFDSFGSSVAILGNVAMVSAPNAGVSATGGDEPGIVYFFERINGNWAETESFTSRTPSPFGTYGSSVAIGSEFSLAGWEEASTTAGTTSGAVDVFANGNGTWVRAETIDAGDTGSGDRFGYSVDIEDNTAVIGAATDITAAGLNAGSIYVFTRSGAAWTRQAILNAPDAEEEDCFGSAVAVFNDTLVVGAPGDDVFSFYNFLEPENGSAYVFNRTGSVWTLEDKLIPDASDIRDAFGSSVDIGQGRVVIGAPGRGNYHGSAYVFERGGISTWSQRAILEANPRNALAHFGTSVSLDQDTILVGAPGSGSRSGQAHVFSLEGSTWKSEAVLEAGDMRFGASVSLSGNLALVGAPGVEAGDAPLPSGGGGGAYVFARGNNTWNLAVRLAAEGDATLARRFGQAVALDGAIALIGGEQRDSAALPWTGAAHVFAREGVAWNRQDIIDGETGASSAAALALSGGTAVIASSTADSINPFDGTITPDTGKVRIYRLTGSLVAGPESSLVAAFDADSSGALSFTEWLSIYVKPPAAAKEKLFAKADTDESGAVSLDEFTAAGSAPATARVVGGWTARATIFLEVDTNEDGIIMREEVGAMWAPGTAAKVIDGFWIRAKGGSGLDLAEWVKTKTLPNFSTYEAAKALRVHRLAVAESLDTDDNGMMTRTEFAVLLGAGASEAEIEAAWRAATAAPRGGTAPAEIPLILFVEAPKLPKLPGA
jgi:hypothetical protein